MSSPLTTHPSPLTPAARFVILHHAAPQGEHWDLMLEQGDKLATWHLLADPRRDDVWPIAARRIGDHRMDYLTYEGPLTGDRGTVSRLDAGSFQWLSEGQGHRDVHLDGRIVRGTFRLELAESDGEDRWYLRRV